jgi:alanine racemase
MKSNVDRIAAILAGTHARISLDRYEDNIRILRRLAGHERGFMAVVKGNAYGHGAVACARAAIAAGATYLAVARIGEALQLRIAGIDDPILVLGSPNPETIGLAAEYRITLTVGTVNAMEGVRSAAIRSSLRPVIHLKLDSGLHRYGASPELALELARTLAADERVDLEGIYAHFSSADEDDFAPTANQIALAEAVLKELASAGIKFRYVHLPNSAATILGRTGPSNLVRSGIATYGLAPSAEVPLPGGVKPVMTLHSRLSRVFELQPGEGVSYGLTYRASRKEWVATVPVGYADGLPRSLSGRGWFIVEGCRCPIRGRVCMDQTVVGLPDQVREGSDVQIMGDGSDDAMDAFTIANLDGTINYEIATGVAARVPRLYLRGGAPTGWADQLLDESQGI